VFLIGCSKLFVYRDAEDALVLTECPLSNVFSFSVLGVVRASVAPGVFGVLDDPNDANAPDPRPKAEDPPAPGDATPAGVIELKGLVFP
jgi:hypothetical protein